jgi:hypothetical protein
MTPEGGRRAFLRIPKGPLPAPQRSFKGGSALWVRARQIFHVYRASYRWS